MPMGWILVSVGWAGVVLMFWGFYAFMEGRMSGAMSILVVGIGIAGIGASSWMLQHAALNGLLN